MERSAIQENARDESDFGHVAGRSSPSGAVTWIALRFIQATSLRHHGVLCVVGAQVRRTLCGLACLGRAEEFAPLAGLARLYYGAKNLGSAGVVRFTPGRCGLLLMRGPLLRCSPGRGVIVQIL